MGHAKKIDTELAVRTDRDARIAALRALSLRDYEVLCAYYACARMQGARCEPVRLCWSSDEYVGRRSGRVAESVRRARAALARGASPFLFYRHLRSGDFLPNGDRTADDVTLVVLLPYGLLGEAALVADFVDAMTELRRAEATGGSEVLAASERAAALGAQVTALYSALPANDSSHLDAASSHKAPTAPPIPARFAPRKTGKPSTPPPARRRRVA